MMSKMLLSALLLTSVFAMNSVSAQDAKAVAKAPVLQAAGYQFAGVSLGMAKPNGDLGTPLRFAFGADYAFALNEQLAVGAFVSRNDGEVDIDSPIDLAITRVGAQVIYSPTYDSYLDLRTGITFLDVSTKFGNTKISRASDSNPIFVGPGAGIIFPIFDKVQFVPNIHYTYFFETSDTTEFTVFDVAASFRYQF
jgi:hypothetical protein